MKIEIMLGEAGNTVSGYNVPKITTKKDIDHQKRLVKISDLNIEEDAIEEEAKQKAALDKRIEKRRSATVMSAFKFGTSQKDPSKPKKDEEDEEEDDKKKPKDDADSEDDEEEEDEEESDDDDLDA